MILIRILLNISYGHHFDMEYDTLGRISMTVVYDFSMK